MKQVTIKVPDQLHKELKVLAISNDITLNQIFLDAARAWALKRTLNPDCNNEEQREPNRT